MEMIFGLLETGTAVNYSKVLGGRNDFSIRFCSELKGLQDGI